MANKNKRYKLVVVFENNHSHVVPFEDKEKAEENKAVFEKVRKVKSVNVVCISQQEYDKICKETR